MKKINKKIIFAVSLIILTLAAGVFFIFFYKTPERIRTQINPVKPSIPSLTSNYSIVFNVSEENFNIPKSVRLVQREKVIPFTREEVIKISQDYGFTSEPIIAQDTLDGETFIWSDNTKSLTIYTTKREVNFGLNDQEVGINKQLSEEELIETAKQFLTTRSKLFSPDDLYFSYFTYIKSEEGTERILTTAKDEAEIYIINFFSVDSDLKIKTLNTHMSPISVWVNQSGEIIKSSAQIVKHKLTELEYETKNYNQIKETIKEAALLSLDNGNIPSYKLEETLLGDIVIDKIELGYLIEDNSEVHQPIFILEGTTKINGNPISAQLYLPALK